MEDPLVPRDVFDLQIDIPSFLDDAVVHLAYICPFRGSWIPTVGSSCCGRRLPASHWTPTCFSPAPPACTSPAGSKACVGGRWAFPAQSSSAPSTPSSSVGLFHQTPGDDLSLHPTLEAEDAGAASVLVFLLMTYV